MNPRELLRSAGVTDPTAAQLAAVERAWVNNTPGDGSAKFVKVLDGRVDPPTTVTVSHPFGPPVVLANNKMLYPTEHQEQVAVIQWADAHRDGRLRLLVAIPNWIGPRTARHGAFLKAEGRRAGFPDLFLPLPSTRTEECGLFIEMKRQNASPSDTTPEQREWHARLRGSYAVEVCRGADAAITVICAYLGIKP